MRKFLRECIPSLPRIVWIIQLGNVVNFFGYGLVLPFELIYLHDHRGFSLPMSGLIVSTVMAVNDPAGPAHATLDRKSTRLNSSHPSISYAVFCLKKKKKNVNGKTAART